MKKLIPIIVVVVIVVLGIIFVPKLVHKCDDCGETFFGTGYEPSALNDLLGDEEMIICEECAENHHAVELLLGKELDEYKRDLF